MIVSILHKVPGKCKFWRMPLLLMLKYEFLSFFRKDVVCVKYWINAPVFLWTKSIKNYNWGDYINMPLAELISNKKVIPHRFCKRPSVAMVGSILPWAISKDTIIWGSGCLDSHDDAWIHVEKPLKVCAVRGPLTRKVLLNHGIDCPKVFGDPALLFPLFYHPTPKNIQYKIGIILHASSFLNPIPDFSFLSDSVLVISPTKFNRWQDFIDDVLSCEMILSSSLHGIIIADAYRVPNQWITLTNNEHPDNNFKFRDYYLSINKQITHPKPIMSLSYNEIMSLKDTWCEPNIDLDKLLHSCPFYNEQC